MTEPAQAKQAFAQVQELMGIKPEQSETEQKMALMERLLNSQAYVIDSQRAHIEALQQRVKRIEEAQEKMP